MTSSPKKGASKRGIGQIVLNVVTGVVVLLALFIGGTRVKEMLYPKDPNAPQKPVLVDNWEFYGKEGIRLGAKNPVLTVVEFSDFRCPFCAEAASDVKMLLSRYSDSIAIVYCHMPLHTHSREAGLAAECAMRQGSFERLHDGFFAQPDSIGVRSWTSFALEAGISDTTRFTSCMNSASADSALVRDSIAAAQLGINETPTFLLNNMKIKGNVGLARLDQIAQQAMARQLR